MLTIRKFLGFFTLNNYLVKKTQKNTLVNNIFALSTIKKVLEMHKYISTKKSKSGL